ncbi:MAG: hypothetical protein PUD81_03490 [Eggerthellales bacterium]|nr:hypothetical protein [Eggerthellales bacterium]
MAFDEKDDTTFKADETEGINKQFIRAESEDDDGYDPYSDRVATTPLFERDPWD